MSYITTADEKIRKVKNHLYEIASELSDVLIDECHGFDELNNDYRELLWEVMVTTKKFKDKL